MRRHPVSGSGSASIRSYISLYPRSIIIQITTYIGIMCRVLDIPPCSCFALAYDTNEAQPQLRSRGCQARAAYGCDARRRTQPCDTLGSCGVAPVYCWARLGTVCRLGGSGFKHSSVSCLVDCACSIQFRKAKHKVNERKL